MEVKVFKIELMVIDFDNIGQTAIKDVLENTKYPNRCIDPEVQNIEHQTVEWTDEHPLNFTTTSKQAYQELFKKG